MAELREVRFFRETIEGRRGEILDAALSVFRARGFDGGSMREIAELVGISEPALYRHFQGKDDLFENLIAEAGKRILGEVGPLIDTATPQNVREIFEALIADRQAAFSKHMPLVQTIMVASMHNPAFMTSYRAAIVRPLTDRVAEVIVLMDEHFGTSVPANELPARVRLLMSLFVGYFITSFAIDGDTATPGEIMMRGMGWEKSAVPRAPRQGRSR